MQLRDYQQSVLDAALAWIKYKSSECGYVTASGGSGKSIMIAKVAEAAADMGKRVIILARSEKLLRQNRAKIAPAYEVGIYCAGLEQWDDSKQITVASIQSIANLTEIEPPDLILVDECFTGETLISTPTGERRIDTLKIGDKVLNAYGHGTISSIFCSSTTHLINVRLSNGETIKCTRDHPFFTERGWVKCENLERGEVLFSEERLSILWENIYPKYSTRAWRRCATNGSVLEKEKILFNILREEAHKPDERQCHSHEDARYPSENKTRSNQTRRQWEVIATTSTCFIACAWGGVASRIGDKNKRRSFKWGLSKLLQGGHRKRINENCRRDRWEIPSWFACRDRQEKRRAFIPIRVEDVSHIERESATPVFNLRVSGHPSYFAGGVLVHNCHNIAQGSDSETQYWNFFRLCGNPQIIGFTATPFRTGTGKIQWGSEIINIPIAPLIDAGYIMPPVNKCSNTPDLSNVQIRLGEYVESQLESIFLEPELLSASVARIKHYSAHRESVLIFCQTLKHCEALSQAMIYNEMPALVVHGGTPKKELDVILKRFEAREFKYLINCNLLTEGYDSPNIDMVAVLRSTVSKGLFEQMVYRGCRPYPGKENFLLLDMGGNLIKHGALGSPYREKDKKERAKSEGKVCPACEEFVPPLIMQCTCGYEFPPTEARLINHETSEDASSATVYRGGIEEYEVTGVTYREHKSKAGNTTLRIDYHCNANKYGAISEWYSPFHDSDWARNKVYQLFKSRGHMLGSDPKTYSMDDLLWHAEFMKKPTKITVDNSDKFPRVIGCEFGEVKKPVVEEVVIIDDEIIW